jgi:hypothetical protein
MKCPECKARGEALNTLAWDLTREREKRAALCKWLRDRIDLWELPRVAPYLRGMPAEDCRTVLNIMGEPEKPPAEQKKGQADDGD